LQAGAMEFLLKKCGVIYATVPYDTPESRAAFCLRYIEEARTEAAIQHVMF
jgi:hypothetical protein